MQKFFFFDSMLTPKILTFVYWILCLVAIISGITYMFVAGWNGPTFWSFIQGLFIIAFGVVGSRIWCELLIVIFKINDNLRTIASKE
jgi:hypothetical protein